MDPRYTIRSHLRLVRWPAAKSEHLGLAYRGPADFVLRHGRWWTPRPRPAGLPQAMPRACYGNAIGGAVLYGFRYVQGYAVHSAAPDLPVPHAWNADAGGNVVDLTWNPVGIAYLGVELSAERADDGTWNGDADPLDDWRRGWPLLRSRWRGELPEPDPSWEPSPLLLAMRAALAGDQAEAVRLYRLSLEETG